MNPGPTADRVYDALKRRIMDRAYRPGDRLDPAVLAEPLASSVTPVRDALHLLTGEGLVEARPNDGFHLPALDEPGLKDLYAWSGELLALAVRARSQRTAPPFRTDERQADAGFADRTAALFLAMGQWSVNGEHGVAINRLNARLHAVRNVEARVIHATESELGALEAAAASGETEMFLRLSSSYHRRRRRAAADIVRAVYRFD